MGVDQPRHQQLAPAIEDAGIGMHGPEAGLVPGIVRSESDAVARDAQSAAERTGLPSDGSHRQNSGVGKKKN